ncbi:MAG: membrane protein insertion efficiency factor YidD [Flammeovirgaceae bacterium]
MNVFKIYKKCGGEFVVLNKRSIASITLTLFFFFLNGKTLAQANQVVEEYISFYQKYISGIRPTQCPMYPTCSSYGMSQFKNRIFFSAMTATSERLMRCGHEQSLYSIKLTGDRHQLIDNVSDSLNFSMRYRPMQIFFLDSIENTDLLVVKKLINSGLYNAALLEIERLRIMEKWQGNSQLAELYLKSLNSIGEYEKVIYEYQVNLTLTQKIDLGVVHETSKAWTYLGQFKESNKILNQLRSINSFKLNSLSLYNYLRLNQVDSAKTICKRLGSSNPLFEQKLTDFIATTKKDKNLTIAGSLAAVPGLGYLYTRHKQTALTALLINTALAYATYTSLQTKNYGVGAIMAVFGLSFYIGNIQGSVKSAKRYNDAAREKAFKNIERLIGF